MRPGRRALFIDIQTNPLSLYSHKPTKRSYLALGSRIELYYLVSELVELGLSYRQIQQAVLRQKHAWLSKSTTSYWARRIHSPLGRVNQFQSGPSPELAYVMGAVLGDGNLNIHGYNAELNFSRDRLRFRRRVQCIPRNNSWPTQALQGSLASEKEQMDCSRVEYSSLQLSQP